MEKEAQEKDRAHKLEVDRLQGRIRELENSTKWIHEATQSGRAEIQALKNKLRHAMDVIVDLVGKVSESIYFI